LMMPWWNSGETRPLFWKIPYDIFVLLMTQWWKRKPYSTECGNWKPAEPLCPLPTATGMVGLLGIKQFMCVTSSKPTLLHISVRLHIHVRLPRLTSMRFWFLYWEPYFSVSYLEEMSCFLFWILVVPVALRISHQLYV
jgi:hypothetical protein